MIKIIDKLRYFIAPPVFSEDFILFKYAGLIGGTSFFYILFWWYVGLYIIIPVNIITGSIILSSIFLVRKKIISARLGLNMLLGFGLIEIFFVSLFSWHHTSIILDWLMMIPLGAYLFIGGGKRAAIWAIPCLITFITVPILNHYMFTTFLKYEHFNIERLKIINVVSIVFLFVDIMLLSIEYSNLRDLKDKNLKLQNEELVSIQNDIIQTQKYKDQFFANISHELRTPMNAIHGISELLEKADLDDETNELVKSLKTSSSHLVSVINDILDYSKIQEGKLILSRNVFDLPEMLNDAYNILKYTASEKKIDYRLKFENKLPQNIESDQQRIKQVIVNLLGNAIKFTDEGIVEMRCSLINNQISDNVLRVEIQDTGIGISKDYLDDIFESYSQADAYITNKFGGTGLGLNISKKLIKMLNGTIGCNSVIGKGSIFYIELPLNIVNENTLLINSKNTDSIIVSEINPNLNLLIVDDNQMNLTITKKIIQKCVPDAIIDLCEDGMQALSITSKKRYDIILMDLQMPVMNGIEATIAIRNNAINLNSKSAIIAFTANANEGEIKKCIDAGMDDYITKPFELKDLVSKIQLYSKI
jgi:signal transduction histidine kinase/ActR/RegA family two-component response regulator